ncbi:MULTISPECIES: aspartate/glutamate racemase family protein [unclassified Bosea (in: a-proteobacteria)]|uniref:aspartate/glutamate racemase family protein n=1 Tax=unclassified Bosea (in: a-proteobacteria) TaxID=2653178 RepID=UPI000F74E345|nr:MULTISPECIES: aspartate/glutamate racemase family protein [unclassified Bosea (in: a-proteobacteria)]AZO80273.1 Asp/Glu racemase [Bosea sp. Tri-49]RXT23070.1 Asp/Glu racemase [Bosea sp. Tri-39]RXT38541.1 Asp/Glu racemase [Bosea sp. Tri-54]
MRILILNPNTSIEMTELVLHVLAPLTPAGVTLKPATGRFGARYISSRSAGAIAGHAALDAFAEQGADCDAVYLACFGDPGLMALKEIAGVPVIGMAEAACQQAASQGGRFSIVTGGERWGAILTEFVAALGLDGRLAAVETVAPTGGDIAADPDGSLTLLAEASRRTVERDGAQAVILGGAGLAGLAARVQPYVGVPVICSTEAGFAAVLEAARNPLPKPVQGDLALPAAVPNVGLSAGLARLLGER